MKKVYASVMVVICVLFTGTIHATDYYLKSTGNAGLETSWGTNTNGSGTSPVDFSGVNDVWHFVNQSSVSLTNNNFNPPSTATVIVESGILLTLSSNCTLPARLSALAGGSINISRANVFTFGTLSAGSTVILNGTSLTQATTYANLMVSANSTVTATGAVISGTLTINSGITLRIAGVDITFGGLITGTGKFTGAPTASVHLTPGIGGSNGTLRFVTGEKRLTNLEVNYTTVSAVSNR
jgi:hypothetical protein